MAEPISTEAVKLMKGVRNLIKRRPPSPKNKSQYEVLAVELEQLAKHLRDTTAKVPTEPRSYRL